MIQVEVAYATPEKQLIVNAKVLPNATIEEAVRASGMLEQFPEIELTSAKVGVFGRLATLQTRLTAGDRVEIYRPLLIDPKLARKQRVAKKPT